MPTAETEDAPETDPIATAVLEPTPDTEDPPMALERERAVAKPIAAAVARPDEINCPRVAA